MREVLTFGLRSGLFTAGVLLFYASLSYETEEGKIQNLLEEWWIKVDDYKRQALSKHIAFLKTLAAVSTRILDQLFGPSLISLQAIGVSLCLCSVCIGVMALILGGIMPHKDLSISSSLWIIFSSGLYGIIPAFVQRLARRWLRVGSIYLWFTVLIISQLRGLGFLFLVLLVGLGHSDPDVQLGAAIVLAFFAILFSSVALFVFLVALMRRTVRAMSNSNSAMRIVGISVFNVVPPFVLVGMIIGAIEMPYFGRTGIVIMVFVILFGAFGLVINFPFLLSAVMFIVIALTMFVHRLFWPAISRPLYKLQALGVAKRPTLFRAIGVALMSAAVGWNQWIWFIASKLV